MLRRVAVSACAPVQLLRASAASASAMAPSARRAMSGDHDHHHGPLPAEPPFVRLPKATGPVHENDEVIWNDGVAPETALDFDAPHISAWQGLAMWLGGFAFFSGVFGFAVATGHPGNKISGDRDLPESGKAALGGYANGKW